MGYNDRTAAIVYAEGLNLLHAIVSSSRSRADHEATFGSLSDALTNMKGVIEAVSRGDLGGPDQLVDKVLPNVEVIISELRQWHYDALASQRLIEAANRVLAEFKPHRDE